MRPCVRAFIALVFPATGAIALLSGCLAPPREIESSRERARRVYDREARQLDVLADFETAGQLAWLRVESDSPAAPQPVLSTAVARQETGSRSAACRLGAGDRLVLDVSRATPPRGDWQNRTLLMLSVHAPPEGAVIALRITEPASAPAARPPDGEFATATQPASAATSRPDDPGTAPATAAATGPEAQSGEPAAASPRAWERRFALQPGWNVLRVDLDELRDTVALERVGLLELWPPDATAPIDLYLDDVLLIDDSREIVPVTDGECLQISARGRRLRIVALGATLPVERGPGEPGSPPPRLDPRRRFELTFADGVIVAAGGESELSLCPPTGLGPWPLALPEAWWEAEPPPAYDSAHMFEAWGGSASASQALIEATPFRAVVRGRWRFHDQPGIAPGDERPGHAWQYTVYPDGRVYLSVTSNAGDRGWPAPLAAYAIALAGGRGFKTAAGPDDAPFILFSRAGPAETDVLWAPYDARWMRPQRVLASADDSRLAVIAGAGPAAPVLASAHMLRVWPRDLDDAGQAERLVRDYREPAAVSVSPGEVVCDAAGDLDRDGFNESEGCYEVRPARGMVRCTLRHGARLRYRPLFRVHESSGKRAAAYLNGRVLRSIGRDAEGNALVLAPVVTDRPFALEVVLREP